MQKVSYISFMIVIVLFRFVAVQAQQMPLYSDYIMNGFVINPAVAGSDGFTTVGLAARDHMLGFDNSPKTNVLSFQTRLLHQNYKIHKSNFFGNKSVSKRSGRVGIGAQLFTDNNGYMERTGGQFTYAYHINMEKSQLSFGLALTTFQFHIALEKLKFRDSEPITNTDQSFANQILAPDLSAGTYLLTSNSFLGLSIANLFQSRIKIGSESYDYRLYRHYFLMGGKRFNAESEFAFEPSFLLKGTEKMIFQADLQMRAYYMQDYYFGLLYRTGSAVGFILGAKWNRIHFCYSFDYSLNTIGKYSFGAHELNIAIKFGDSARRYRWLIRY
jgi:type IX secretion system PorP/SprF family membrane protein